MSIARFAANLLPVPAVVSHLPAHLLPGNGHSKNPEFSASEKSGRLGKHRKGQRVLILSRFGELALYRAELLRERGFSVWLPKTKDEAIAIIDHGDFDVAVFSYTLPNDHVHELTDRIRSLHPGRPLVAISDSGVVDRKIRPEETVLATEGPASLVAALRRLLEGK